MIYFKCFKTFERYFYMNLLFIQLKVFSFSNERDGVIGLTINFFFYLSRDNKNTFWGNKNGIKVSPCCSLSIDWKVETDGIKFVYVLRYCGKFPFLSEKISKSTKKRKKISMDLIQRSTVIFNLMTMINHIVL